MAEETSLARAAPPATGFDRPGLKLAIEPLGIARLRIHGPAFDDRFAAIAGFAPPPPRRQIAQAGLTIAWLAPGEWLLSGDEPAVAAWLDRVDADDALAVDITHARTSFLLSGADARLALAAHSPLDLWPDIFPVDAVARTVFADTVMFIARLADYDDAPCFRIVVDQTMARYVVRMLTGA